MRDAWLVVIIVVLGLAAVPLTSRAATPAAAALASLQASRGALDASGAASCADSCCVPHASWFGLGAATDEEAQAARDVLRGKAAPEIATLALRVLSTRAQLEDTAVIARWLDDDRAGPPLPSIFLTQQVQRCYPTTWEAVTVSGEALRALSRLYGTTFSTAAAARAWLRTHADPETTFDYWYLRLSKGRPADAAALARLARQPRQLVARVLAAYCEADTDCDHLDGRLRAALSPARALGWLDGTTHFPEWDQDDIRDRVTATLLRHGATLFRRRQLAALAALAPKLPSYRRGSLAVLLGRLDPPHARDRWRAALAEARGEVDGGTLEILREAARRDPAGFSDELAAWCYGPAVAASRANDAAAAILQGLAEAGPAGKAMFLRLAATPQLDITDLSVAMALASAARAHGCADAPDPAQLIPRAKQRDRASLAGEEHRLTSVRAALLAAVKGCGK